MMRGRLKTPETSESLIPHERLEHEDELQRYFKLTGVTLGKGSFGVVIEAQDLRDPLCSVAIKKVDKAKAGTAEVKLLEREVSILKSITHPFIIHLIRVFETSQTMYLVQEKCECELGQLLAKQSQNKLAETACQNVIRQTAKALYYLHRKNIYHRDLKCENILVKNSKTNNIKDIEIRITDFGLAVDSGQEFQETTCGTPLYMAPEILSRQSYSKNVDIWSLGIIAYKIMTGKFPFPDNLSQSELTKKIQEGKFDFSTRVFIDYSERAIDLVKRMLKVDPATRIQAGEIEDSAWVQGREGNDKKNVLDMMQDFLAETENGEITEESVTSFLS